MIKPIPYGRQNITDQDINAVVEVLKSDFLTQGPKIIDLENKFSNYVGSKYSVAVSNGTAALHLCSMAMNVKPGDKVITTPITFSASANCIRYCGGEIVFGDIDPETYLLDINSVRELLKSSPSGTYKGIIPVDFAGLPINMEEYKKLAIKNNLWIIEDACHAPGGYFVDSKGLKNFTGNGVYADISVFSFHPVKHIACGEGGMLTTNSKQLYNKLMLLRTHGITKKGMKGNHGKWYYEMQELGFNYRLTDIQSALGIIQLTKNRKGVEIRNRIAKKYKEAFDGKIKYQFLPKKSYNAHHLFVIEVEKRKELYEYLRSNGILTQIHYIPVHTFPYYKNIGYEGADLINSENYYLKCLSLPMYPTLTNKEQNKVIELIKSFFNA